MVTPNYRPDPIIARRIQQEIIGSRLWSKQIEVTDSVFGPKRNTAVKAGTGLGKTMVCAGIAIAYLVSAPDRLVITTAPTMRQVQDMLWKEIRAAFRSAAARGYNLGGELLPQAPRWNIRDGWQALGFSSTNEVNFQGYHSRGGTLVIVDEAVGVDDGAFDALEATLTGANDRLLAIANPTTPVGRFFEMCTHPRYEATTNRITISALDSPNYRRRRTVIPGLVDYETVERNRLAWGEDSPMWQARVLGEFPTVGGNTLVPLSWATAAVVRWKERADAGYVFDDDEAGVDVARMGDDASVLAHVRWGKRAIVVEQLKSIRKHDLMEVTGWVAAHIRDLRLSRVKVDDSGLGGGVVDRLVEQGHHVVRMIAGSRSAAPERFANSRSEWLWRLREMLDPSAPIPLLLPDDNHLIHQMTSMRYGFDSQGRIVVEAKDEWKKRNAKAGRSSPDELDAVSYALADRTQVQTSLASYLAAYG